MYLCTALLFGTFKCDVSYFDEPFCYLGNQADFNQIYHSIANQVVVVAKQWVLLASQSSGAWFSPNEWSTSSVGKFAALDQMENFR